MEKCDKHPKPFGVERLAQEQNLVVNRPPWAEEHTISGVIKLCKSSEHFLDNSG